MLNWFFEWIEERTAAAVSSGIRKGAERVRGSDAGVVTNAMADGDDSTAKHTAVTIIDGLVASAEQSAESTKPSGRRPRRPKAIAAATN